MVPSTVTFAERRAELALLDRLIAGDEEAWRTLHARYGRLMVRCIQRVTRRFPRVVSPEDDREIFANLLLELVSRDKRKLRLFQASRGNRLSTWLGLLASHAAFDYLRALRRDRGLVPLEDDSAALRDETTPYDYLEGWQHRRIVASMMAELSDKDRQFVVLYFDRGLAPEAVATVMNISLKTVYSKKHKIRSRLEIMATTQRLAA